MSTVGTKYRGTKEYQLVYCKLLGAAQRHDEVLYAEIAEVMGISVKGVENQLARGIERMRSLMT